MQLGWVSVQWRQLGDARFVVHAACVICQRVQKSFPRCRRLVRRLFRRIQSMLSSQLNPWLTPLLHMIEFYPHCVHKELLRKKKKSMWSKRIQQQPLFIERSLYALANIAVALRFLEYGYAFGRAAAVTLRHASDGGNLAVSFIQVPAEFLSTRAKALQSASCWLWLNNIFITGAFAFT